MCTATIVVEDWVQLAREQGGSRFIQEQVENGGTSQRDRIFKELLPALNSLMEDMFGNYVVQKYLEFGTPEQKFVIVERLQGRVLSLTMQMYGCRVVQKAMETLPPEQQVRSSPIPGLPPPLGIWK